MKWAFTLLLGVAMGCSQAPRATDPRGTIVTPAAGGGGGTGAAGVAANIVPPVGAAPQLGAANAGAAAVSGAAPVRAAPAAAGAKAVASAGAAAGMAAAPGASAGAGAVAGAASSGVDDPAAISRTLGVDASAGFMLTVYHTPVESFHSQPKQAVVGCAKKGCSNGKDDLGSYPADFVQAVKDQGTGRLTSGMYAGKYLNWAGDIGYWLDDATRDARGQPLVPWVSAAADPRVAFGMHFQVVDCGVDEGQGTPINAKVCTAIKSASWSVNDRFEVGAVGAQFDLYIGEEDQPNYDAESPFLITSVRARIKLLQ